MLLLKHKFSSDTLSIGEKMKIGDELYMVKEIVKVSFYSNTIWFYGIPLSELK